MIQTIVFSRDRPAQLDLLLRSIDARAKGMFSPIHIIFTGTSKEFFEGYDLCAKQHPDVLFHQQHNFTQDVRDRMNFGAGDHVTFFCDDDLVTRPFLDYPHPATVLRNNDDVLCVSLRLGLNTNYCYPMRAPQSLPPMEVYHDVLLWRWTGCDGDWGYPGSLDGHVFRRNTLLPFLENVSFDNPNELEEYLVKRCYRANEYMACYKQSLITGIPINRVNDTHPNRNGELHPRDPGLLNEHYLQGKRLNLGAIKYKQINAAHTELPLVFA